VAPRPVDRDHVLSALRCEAAPAGFPTCAESVLEITGPVDVRGIEGWTGGQRACVVSFGTERVAETVSVQPFFAAGGNLQFYVQGTSPVSIEIISKAVSRRRLRPSVRSLLPKCR